MRYRRSSGKGGRTWLSQKTRFTRTASGPRANKADTPIELRQPSPYSGRCGDATRPHDSLAAPITHAGPHLTNLIEASAHQSRMQGFAGRVNCPPSPPGSHEPGCTELSELSPYGGAGRARGIVPSATIHLSNGVKSADSATAQV
jgi:hypothetical protein